MELFKLRRKMICRVKYIINKNIKKQSYTKFNTSDTTLKRILHVATLYFNRILHILIKDRR